MSRTDSHMPHWATCTWYLPVHLRCENSTRTHWSITQSIRHACDLPVRPVRSRPVLSAWLRSQGTRCYWEPDWTGVSPWPRPPRWFVEHHYHNVERRRSRDGLRDAAAEWRATGHVETVPEPRQARGGARWAWA